MKVGIVEAKTKRNQLRNKTFKCVKFDSNFTFLDYDIIIWEAETLAEDLFEKAYDKRTYVDDSKIKNKLKIIERRDTEMMHLLELGRTIFIHLPPPQKIYNMEKKEFFDILNC